MAATTNPLVDYKQSAKDVQVQYTVHWGQEEEEDELMALHRYSSEESLVATTTSLRRKQRKVDQRGVIWLHGRPSTCS